MVRRIGNVLVLTLLALAIACGPDDGPPTGEGPPLSPESADDADVRQRGLMPWGSSVVEVEYVVTDGLYLFQGDIILDPSQLVPDHPRPTALAAGSPAARWPAGVIPFEIDPALPDHARVHAAVDHINSSTSLRLVPRTNETAYVRVEPGAGCYANVGHLGSEQRIVLANACGFDAVVHEFGHAIGLWHTQSRNDRDRYVRVHFENIAPDKRTNFATLDEIGVDGLHVGPYDTNSVMHYSPYAFSANGKPTITLLDGTVYEQTHDGLTENDAAGIDGYYADQVASRPVVTLPGRFGGGGRLAQFREDGSWWVGSAAADTVAFEKWGQFSTRNGWTNHLVGDFDGDGHDDVASYHPGAGRWWVGRSTGTSFAHALWAEYTTRTGWSPNLVGDFDGDGRDDIATYHQGSGRWWVGKSDGIAFDLQLWAEFSTRDGWEPQLAGDFDGDGRDDLAGYHAGAGRWWVSSSTGASFDPALWAQFSTRDGWTEQRAGDFDGDGAADVINYHAESGRWWVGASSGESFDTRLWAEFTSRDGWAKHEIADFDGDGDDDVAHYHPAGGRWWMTLSDGDHFVVQKWADYGAPTAFVDQVAVDFDDDGAADLAQTTDGVRWRIAYSTGHSFAPEGW